MDVARRRKAGDAPYFAECLRINREDHMGVIDNDPPQSVGHRHRLGNISETIAVGPEESLVDDCALGRIIIGKRTVSILKITFTDDKKSVA